MLYHRRRPSAGNITPEYPGIQEVARWVEPTRVLVLSDKHGVRRLRVEMMDSDVTSEALEALVDLLTVVETLNPAPGVSSGASSAIAPLQLVASPPH